MSDETLNPGTAPESTPEAPESTETGESTPTAPEGQPEAGTPSEGQPEAPAEDPAGHVVP